MGVPIADKHMMVGVSFDFKESLDRLQKEMVMKTVAQQEAKMESYKILESKGLPIPPDLQAEIAAMEGGAAQGGGLPPGAPTMPPPPGGGPIPMPGLPDDLLGPGGAGGATPMGGPPPASPISPQQGPVPEISNERRPGLQYNRQSSKENDYELQPDGKSAIKKATTAKRQRSFKLIQEEHE